MTAFWRYWLLQIPGWVVLSALVAAAMEWFHLPFIAGLAVFFIWLVKDLVLYPVLKAYYVPRRKDIHDGILGEKAVAQESLEPTGYVKLRGELWMAEVTGPHPLVAAGESVVVESVDGLKLKVKR